MTHEKITQANALIAEFMGMKPKHFFGSKNIPWYAAHDLNKAGLPFSPGAMGNGTDELKFHLSWDWLMPVVYRIDKTKLTSIDIETNLTRSAYNHQTKHFHSHGRLNNTYNAVVDFINNYKDNKHWLT